MFARLKLRGSCRGGPPWPPLGQQITYCENRLLFQASRSFRRPPLVEYEQAGSVRSQVANFLSVIYNHSFQATD